MWKARVPAAADSPAHPICAPTCENLSSSFSPLPLYTFILLPEIFFSPPPSFLFVSAIFSPLCCFLARVTRLVSTAGGQLFPHCAVVASPHCLQGALYLLSFSRFHWDLSFLRTRSCQQGVQCTSNAEKNSALQSCFQHLAVVGSQVAIALLSASRGR